MKVIFPDFLIHLHGDEKAREERRKQIYDLNFKNQQGSGDPPTYGSLLPIKDSEIYNLITYLLKIMIQI